MKARWDMAVLVLSRHLSLDKHSQKSLLPAPLRELLKTSGIEGSHDFSALPQHRSPRAPGILRGTYLAWYIGTPRKLLQAEPLRFAETHRPPHFRDWAAAPLTTGRWCHQALTAYSDHFFPCPQGPGSRHHNRLCDVWVPLCRKAGWYEDSEQTELIYIAAGETKRVDLLTLTPEGQVAAGPRFSPHHHHVRNKTQGKTPPETVSFMTKPNWVPLVHDAHNRWSSSEVLRRLHHTSAQARHSAPTALQVWSTHFAMAIAEATTALMHDAVLSSWRMHAFCGRIQ